MRDSPDLALPVGNVGMNSPSILNDLAQKGRYDTLFQGILSIVPSELIFFIPCSSSHRRQATICTDLDGRWEVIRISDRAGF